MPLFFKMPQFYCIYHICDVYPHLNSGHAMGNRKEDNVKLAFAMWLPHMLCVCCAVAEYLPCTCMDNVNFRDRLPPLANVLHASKTLTTKRRSSIHAWHLPGGCVLLACSGRSLVLHLPLNCMLKKAQFHFIFLPILCYYLHSACFFCN